MINSRNLLPLQLLVLAGMLCMHTGNELMAQTQDQSTYHSRDANIDLGRGGKKKKNVESHVTNTELSTVSTCGGFRTQTQGGWGTKGSGNNPGKYRDQHFNTAFPNGITIGCGERKLVLTSSKAVQSFLPSGSSARMLSKGTMTNPGKSYKNVLAGQLVAATLSIGFDANDGTFSSSDVSLGDLKFKSGPFFDLSISEVVEIANQYIGGCNSSYSASQLNSALTDFNENYVDGRSDNGKMSCPVQYDVIVSEVSCAGGNDGSIALGNLSGGTAPYQVNWSNGQQGTVISTLVAGDYTYTITDAVGLTTTGKASLENPKPFDIQLSWTDPTCLDENNGTISASGAASYAWSSGQMGPVITDLPAGHYSVTATSASGCMVVKDVVLESAPCCNVTSAGVIGNAQSSCVAFDPQPITSVSLPTGGQGNLEYQWLKKLPGGAYSMIQGANDATYDPGMITTTTMYRRCARRSGCTAFIGESNWITMSVEPTVSVSIEEVQPICPGESGSLTAMGFGNGTLSFNWSNGSTSMTISNLGSGTYTVTVSDDQGCYAVSEATIVVPDPLNAYVTTTSVSGLGLYDGSATVFTSGGTPPYTYSWSNGGTTSSLSNLNVGTYYVTIYDGNGCYTNAEGSVSGPIAAKWGGENRTMNDQLIQLKLVPNIVTPASIPVLFILSDGAPVGSTIELYDVQGNLIERHATTNGELALPSLSQLSSGMYLLRAQSGRKVQTLKFLVP